MCVPAAVTVYGSQCLFDTCQSAARSVTQGLGLYLEAEAALKESLRIRMMNLKPDHNLMATTYRHMVRGAQFDEVHGKRGCASERYELQGKRTVL